MKGNLIFSLLFSGLLFAANNPYAALIKKNDYKIEKNVLTVKLNTLTHDTYYIDLRKINAISVKNFPHAPNLKIVTIFVNGNSFGIRADDSLAKKLKEILTK